MKQVFYSSPWQFFFHGFFLFTALLALYFFKERLFVDTTYFAFYLLNDETFRVEHQRFIVVLSEILPLIAIHFHLGIKSVLIIYSLGHVLYFYVLFLLCYYYFREPMAGLAVLIICISGVRVIFFSPMYEIWYGLGLMVLWDCMLRRGHYQAWLRYAIFVVIEITVLFSYPLFFIPVLFLLLKNLIGTGKRPDLRYLSFFLLIPMWALFKYFSLDEYESSKINAADEVSIMATLGIIFKGSYLSGFMAFLLKNYAEIVFMWIITVVVFLKERKYIAAFLMIDFFLGFILLINITSTGYSNSIYFERLYQSMIPIALLPFLSDVFPKLKGVFVKIITGAIVLVAVLRTREIISQGLLFAKRTEQTERLIEYCRQLPGNKFVINELNYAKPYTLLEWSFPMETLLFSSLKGPDSSLTVCSVEDLAFDNNAAKLTPALYVLRRYDIASIRSLNKKYFRLREGDYHFLNDTCDNDLFINDSLYKNIDITIYPESSYHPGTEALLPLEIINKNAESLCSLPAWTIYFAYRFVKGEEVIENQQYNTLPEVDLSGFYKQDMRVLMPDEPGNYNLEVALVYKGRWLRTFCQREVIIR